ncbi:hypothetical protein B9Z55_007773 [Caenorhabditis nigoni]|uniref:Uncharacterized protein n=1 Tax=Caenorhabditis nigoni TaxID=1611254 RepID=A0A2G5VBB8_9PELO|nr:hypothetical protein B9Z55_007773 [Caenorhabditis nigoni]
MDNQPVLYDGLRTILHHMDANLRIKMSLQMPSIHAIEKSVPLKIRYLRITDTTVEVNDVRYKLGVYRDYPNGDIPEFVKIGNARGGVETDFDQFGFEIPIGSNPILPGDVSVRNGDELVVRSDTDEWEEHYQTELKRCENDLRFYAKKESGIETKLDDAWLTRSPVYRGKDEEELEEMAEEFREKLKPFHCRRQNLPRPFNCYIQLSSMKDGEATPLQRLVYNRKLP